MKNLIVKEGYIYVITGIILSGLAYIILPILSIPFAILTLFFIYFFRNPTRIPVGNDSDYISPADGTVMQVTEIEETEFIKGPAKKITIFLSVFSVHVNRAPISGTIGYYHYKPGRMLPAYKPHAAEENEACTIGIENNEGKRILVRQITGILARRIVCHVREGAKVTRGDSYGLIKFGSCTELIVPASATVLVKAGDKVNGNITILAQEK